MDLTHTRPVTRRNQIGFSPGEHNKLLKAIIEKFKARFVPDGTLIYVRSALEELGYFDAALLSELGITVDSDVKMPDVVLYRPEPRCIFLIDAATGRGQVDSKRRKELIDLFSTTAVGLIFVTAFPNRLIMGRYPGEIAWQTEVWVADSPSHLIHFNGERFLGPYALTPRI